MLVLLLHSRIVIVDKIATDGLWLVLGLIKVIDFEYNAKLSLEDKSAVCYLIKVTYEYVC